MKRELNDDIIQAEVDAIRAEVAEEEAEAAAAEAAERTKQGLDLGAIRHLL